FEASQTEPPTWTLIDQFAFVRSCWMPRNSAVSAFCRYGSSGIGRAYICVAFSRSNPNARIGIDSMSTNTIQGRPLEVGVFSAVDDAREGVQALLAAGFPASEITVVCSDETKERYFREFEHQEPAGTYTPTATIAGGTIGAMLGGLAVVASALA